MFSVGLLNVLFDAISSRIAVKIDFRKLVLVYFCLYFADD